LFVPNLLPTQPPLTFAGAAANKRARGIEPPFQAWEARVLTIGQRPRRAARIPARHYP
jgi:hypothetical protein